MAMNEAEKQNIEEDDENNNNFLDFQENASDEPSSKSVDNQNEENEEFDDNQQNSNNINNPNPQSFHEQDMNDMKDDKESFSQQEKSIKDALKETNFVDNEKNYVDDNQNILSETKYIIRDPFMTTGKFIQLHPHFRIFNHRTNMIRNTIYDNTKKCLTLKSSLQHSENLCRQEATKTIQDFINKLHNLRNLFQNAEKEIKNTIDDVKGGVCRVKKKLTELKNNVNEIDIRINYCENDVGYRLLGKPNFSFMQDTLNKLKLNSTNNTNNNNTTSNYFRGTKTLGEIKTKAATTGFGTTYGQMLNNQ